MIYFKYFNAYHLRELKTEISGPFERFKPSSSTVNAMTSANRLILLLQFPQNIQKVHRSKEKEACPKSLTLIPNSEATHSSYKGLKPSRHL